MREQEEAANERPVQEDTSHDADGDKTQEYGGPQGLEPTRYGDWERKGRCIDF